MLHQAIAMLTEAPPRRVHAIFGVYGDLVTLITVIII